MTDRPILELVCGQARARLVGAQNSGEKAACFRDFCLSRTTASYPQGFGVI